MVGTATCMAVFLAGMAASLAASCTVYCKFKLCANKATIHNYSCMPTGLFSSSFLFRNLSVFCLSTRLPFYTSICHLSADLTHSLLKTCLIFLVLKGEGLALFYLLLLPRRHWELWYSKKTCLHSLLKFRTSSPLILCKRWSQYLWTFCWWQFYSRKQSGDLLLIFIAHNYTTDKIYNIQWF